MLTTLLTRPMAASCVVMIFLSLLNVSSSAFTPFNVIRHLHNKALPPLFYPESEADNMYLIYKARERALAADCSPHEAQMYLHELLKLQSGCTSGNFTGQDWCDLQGGTMFGEQMVNIVARLREKAETRSTRATLPMDGAITTGPEIALYQNSDLVLVFASLMIVSHVLALQQGINHPSLTSVFGEVTPSLQ